MSQHVVVGAGPVGTALALHLADQGERVVVVTRSGSGPTHPGVTRVAADASSSAGMVAVAAGATAVHNCANPPYHRWATDWPPLAHALLTAAEQTGAVLVTVSNLYGYGPVTGPLTEDLPLTATGPKGRTRARMWQEALAAHEAGRVRAVEVRSSNYLSYGPQSQLGDRVMPRLLAGKPVAVLRSADTAHSWTAVEDVVRLLAVVAGDDRAWGRPWHVPTNPPRTTREAVGDLCRVAGVDPVPVREHPRALMRALGLVNPVIRELPEVAYQFEEPFVLDSTAAQRTFGLSPTPWDEVLAGVVAHYRSR